MKGKIAAALLLALLLAVFFGCGTASDPVAYAVDRPAVPLAPDGGKPEASPHLGAEPTEWEPPQALHTIVLSFVGDCMIASFKGKTGPKTFNGVAETVDPSHFFSGVYDIFSSDDFTVGNCENVFTDRPLTEVYKNYSPAYWYKSPAKNAQVFTAGSVEAVSVSNNHSGDYGTAGAEDTKKALEEAGVLWGDSDHPVIFEKYGVKIAVYMTGMWGEYRTVALSGKLAELEKISDYQIIYYHGGTERKYEPDAWRVRASRKLVDAGADLVIGNHPHVLQPIETYHGADIVYSLGNFIFGGSPTDDRFTVIYQKLLTVCEGEILYEDSRIIPVYEYTGSRNTEWRPVPMEEGSRDYQTVLSFMRGECKTPRG